MIGAFICELNSIRIRYGHNQSTDTTKSLKHKHIFQSKIVIIMLLNA